MTLVKSFFNWFLNTPKSLKILIFISLIFQFIYFLYVPICFECDAATYYNYAKAFVLYPGAYVNFDRPPLYPLILFLSGSVIPGSFIGIFLIQFFTGIISVIVFYKILNFFLNNFFSSIFTFFFIFSGIAFVYSKLILAEHLYLLSMLISFYFFIKIFFTNDEPKSISFFYLATLISTLIRWESLIIFIIGSIFLILYFLRNLIHLKKTLLLILVFSTTLFTLTILKAIVKKDISYVGSLTERSGQQLFWTMYRVEIDFAKETCDSNKTLCEMLSLSGHMNSTGQTLINKNNGEYSLIFYETLIKEIAKDPSKTHLYKKNYDKDEYYRLYGKYEGDPKGLVDNMFNSDARDRVGRYWTFIVPFLENKIGKIEAHSLLKNVAKEAFLANPVILFKFFDKSLYWLGINFNGVLTNKDYFHNLFRITEYIDAPFNLADCAKNSLSEHLFSEYKLDRFIYEKLNYVDDFKKISSTMRNIIRCIFGVAFVFILFLIIFCKKRVRIQLLFFSSILCGSIFLLVIFSGGTRQEVLTIPVMILVTSIFLSNFIPRK